MFSIFLVVAYLVHFVCAFSSYYDGNESDDSLHLISKRFVSNDPNKFNDVSQNDYMTRFSSAVKMDNNFYFCTGALINPQWVVTAASCLTFLFSQTNSFNLLFQYENAFGTLGPDNDKYKINVTRLTKTNYFQHPNYSSTAKLKTSNIALIKLPKPVDQLVKDTNQTGKFVPKVLNLPSSSTPLNGDDCFVATFHRKVVLNPYQRTLPKYLQNLKLKLLNDTQSRIECVVTWLTNRASVLAPEHICAGYYGLPYVESLGLFGLFGSFRSFGYVGSCTYENGDVLQCSAGSTGLYYAVGVLNEAHPCDNISNLDPRNIIPSVFTSILSHLDWINNTIRNNPGNL